MNQDCSTIKLVDISTELSLEVVKAERLKTGDGDGLNTAKMDAVYLN